MSSMCLRRTGNKRIGIDLAALIAVSSMAVAQPRITVSSKDGVPISVVKLGSGPAMVMVHGSGSVAMSWAPSLPELSKHFTLYVMDRRGRGQSGDGAKYSIQAEVDDIAAVIAAAGERVILVAHSYGALLAVAAAVQGEPLKNVSRLILYEPPVTENQRPQMAERIEKMNQAAEAGDKDRIVTLFLDGALGPQALASLRDSPSWPMVGPSMAAMAGTLIRESEGVHGFRVTAAELNKWKTPTTMLWGDQSTEVLRSAAQFVCKSMGNCKLVQLEGQGHVAAQLAPALFVSKVLDATGK